MVKSTSVFTDDDVKHAILEYLHERRVNARSIDSAKAGIMEIRSALKLRGMDQKSVIRNLLYLIEATWVREDIRTRQIRTRSGGFVTNESKTYIITNQGIEFFEGKSRFSKPDVPAGINIHNLNGVFSIGDNNLIRNETKHIYEKLEELENKIRLTDQLDDQAKINYRAEVKTIQSQLSKPNPDKDIVNRAYGALRNLAPIASLAPLVSTVGSQLLKIFGG